MSKISVIVPIYNTENYLRECLDSIINQTYKDLEIICVNDGSIDNSAKIIDEYALKDSRIKAIHQKNSGVAHARNTGLSNATGDYIIFLDSDDIFDNSMINKLYNKAVLSNSDITICREFSFIDDVNNYKKIDWTLENKLIPKTNNINLATNADVLLNFCILWPWDKLYKRDFLISNKITFCEDRKLQASEDLVFVGETLVRANSIVILNEFLIKHRYHKNSLEATRNIQTPYLALKKLQEILIETNIYNKLEQSFINLTLHILYWQSSAKQYNKLLKYWLIKNQWLKTFKIFNYGLEYFYDKNEYILFSKKYNKSIFSQLIKLLFSIRNNNNHKEICILGIKFKIKNKYLTLQNEHLRLINSNNKIQEKCNSLDYITGVVKYLQKPLLYDKNLWEMSYIEHFYNDLKQFDIKTLYQNLIKNLDDDSIETVNKILSKTQSVCNSEETHVDIFDKEEMISIEEKLKSFWNRIFKLNENCWAYKKYFLPINHFEMCVFNDKHCIDSLNTAYFKDKHIIDAGGFIGDSAIIFADYTSKSVHSFEPTNENFKNLQKTIELNCKNNIIAIKKALGDTKGNLELFTNGSASGLLDVRNTTTKEICEVTTLDEYVKENNLEVGLIKTDLEGAEQMFLKGAENTIKTQRPTLLISIYHTADDFFNIKPLIKSWDLNYNFKIVKPLDGQILLETMLICEPKEIIND